MRRRGLERRRGTVSSIDVAIHVGLAGSRARHVHRAGAKRTRRFALHSQRVGFTNINAVSGSVEGPSNHALHASVATLSMSDRA